MLPLDSVLACLSPRLEQVIRMQYGIGEKSDYSFEEIAQRFAITTARAEKLTAQAVARACSPLSYRHTLRAAHDHIDASFRCLHLALGIHALHHHLHFSCPPDCLSLLFSALIDLCPPQS